MFIQSKPASVLYKLFIGVLGMVGFWLSLSFYGLSAWRLLSTYAVLGVAIYFILSALVMAFSRRRDAGHPPYPMFEGMLIVNLALLCVGTIVCHLQDANFISISGWHASLIYFVLPFLVFSDWILFMKKGQWRLGDPFFWLSPVVIYASLIILTALDLPATDPYRYPASFLNLYENGLIPMLAWFALIAVLMLTFSYVLILIDYAAGGRISKCIVLPHIKTIVLEDDATPVAESQPEPTIERVEVKLEPMKPSRPKSKPRNNTIKNKAKNASAKKPVARPKAQGSNGTKPGSATRKKPKPKSPQSVATAPWPPRKSNR